MLWVDRVVAGYHPGIDILEDLTLRAEAGRITAVIGPNGAGKSTLLRVVFGLLPPRAGRVLFMEREIQGVPAGARKRMGIGYVPQGPSTFPQMTVEENLLVGGWTIRHDRGQLRERLEHVYALFPVLAGVRRVRATVLSGGQLRMLSIAKELVAMPALLLVDEPTAGLAPRVAGEVYDLLVRSERFAGAHRPDLVLRTGDMPTSKPLRAWLEGCRQVIADTHLDWRDPTRAANAIWAVSLAVSSKMARRIKSSGSPEFDGNPSSPVTAFVF